ncbi:tyrosine-type recombinase/integrase [Hydrogenophaga sp.]|uniref:tyrosine-type recombinase/integrase n=1 Tax=Hydrogenophaga sp. TaxID=1904254 RepID=UPI002715DBDC|nr:tyrosine-type recombinase/integrase [Hydrogenophaga sp.]MDO9134002.1 tyrosine-type recombinase/integrase [Hydrogenophaga sp.]
MDEGKPFGMGDASAGGNEAGRSPNGPPFRPKKKATFLRKSRAQTLKRGGPGSAKPRSDHAIAVYPNDPQKQMAIFLDGLDPQSFIGRERSVSHLTETRFGQTLKRMIGELSELNMPIQRIDQVSRRHAAALVVRWLNEEKQCAATVNNKVSFIRKFCELIGKVGAIPKGEEWYQLLESKGVDRRALVRQQVAYGSKTWSAAGIQPIGIAALLAEDHYHESLLVELMYYFGLRVSEALSLNPTRSDVVGGLMLTSGTKGGKDRLVPYMEDAEIKAKQRDVLDRAIAWVNKNNRRGDMGYPGLSMEKSRQKYYNTLHSVGVTKAHMGVVSHGLRHEYAANMFEQLTGHRPPVEGQEPSDWFKNNRELVDHAYLKVSEALGHWRKSISAAYLGSIAGMSKTQKHRIEMLIEMFQNTPGVAEGLLAVGIERAWLTGRGGQGIQLALHERIQLTVSLKEGASWSVLNDAHALLEKLLPGRVMVAPLLGGVQPDDGVEVFLD